MLIFLFCVVAGVVGFWPDLPATRELRRLLVELPANKLGRLTPGRTIAALLVLVLVVAVVRLANAETMIVLAQGLPQGIAWMVTFDVATYIDVIALASLLSATVRLRAMLAHLAMAAQRTAQYLTHFLSSRLKIGARGRSRRGARKVARPSQDDDGGWPALARFAPRYA